MSRLIGVDFSSAPTRRKPITVACATPVEAGPLRLEHIAAFESLDAWADWLNHPSPWVGAFDFPFALPREFVAGLGWPLAGEGLWADHTRRLAALSRADLVAHCRAWCDARPAGSKFAHRATDRVAGSSPSMKWVNPPVVLMLHAGAPRLLAAGVCLPGLHERGTDPGRIALEGYPGLLARSVLGRASYKSDDPARRGDLVRREARERLVAALERGDHGFEIRIDFGVHRSQCIAEDSADRLDAVLCLAQAAWAWKRRTQRWGLPAVIDPVEGWILGAPVTQAS